MIPADTVKSFNIYIYVLFVIIFLLALGGWIMWGVNKEKDVIILTEYDENGKPNQVDLRPLQVLANAKLLHYSRLVSILLTSYLGLMILLLVIQGTTKIKPVFMILLQLLALIGFSIPIMLYCSRMINTIKFLWEPPKSNPDKTYEISAHSINVFSGYSILVLIVLSIYLLLAFFILAFVGYVFLPNSTRNAVENVFLDLK